MSLLSKESETEIRVGQEVVAQHVKDPNKVSVLKIAALGPQVVLERLGHAGKVVERMTVDIERFMWKRLSKRGGLRFYFPGEEDMPIEAKAIHVLDSMSPLELSRRVWPLTKNPLTEGLPADHLDRDLYFRSRMQN